jgi:hypothetical protein
LSEHRWVFPRPTRGIIVHLRLDLAEEGTDCQRVGLLQSPGLPAVEGRLPPRIREEGGIGQNFARDSVAEAFAGCKAIRNRQVADLDQMIRRQGLARLIGASQDGKGERFEIDRIGTDTACGERPLATVQQALVASEAFASRAHSSNRKGSSGFVAAIPSASRAISAHCPVASWLARLRRCSRPTMTPPPKPETAAAR